MSARTQPGAAAPDGGAARGGLVDLTMPFSSRTIPVPGHPQPHFETLHELDRDGIRNTLMRISIHAGTHVDAPSHIVPDARTIDQIEIDRFHRPGVRHDLTRLARPGEPIGLDLLEEAGFDPGAARGAILLLNTGWSDEAWEREELYGGNPFLARDAAEAVAEAAPSALGLDLAVDEAKPWPNHTVLLGEEVLLIENLMGLDGLGSWPPCTPRSTPRGRGPSCSRRPPPGPSARGPIATWASPSGRG